MSFVVAVLMQSDKQGNNLSTFFDHKYCRKEEYLIALVHPDTWNDVVFKQLYISGYIKLFYSISQLSAVFLITEKTISSSFVIFVRHESHYVIHTSIKSNDVSVYRYFTSFWSCYLYWIRRTWHIVHIRSYPICTNAS